MAWSVVTVVMPSPDNTLHVVKTECCIFRKYKYPKFPKYSDTQIFVVITLKFELCGSTIE